MCNWVIAGFLILASATLRGQPTVVEQVEVVAVEVLVSVTDRNGTPIRGLKADQFEISDDGKRRDISFFLESDLRAGQTGITPTSSVARRKFLLLFDLAYSSPTALVRSRKAARDFVTGSLNPWDLVAVATFRHDSGVHLLTSFTTDRDLVSWAIESRSCLNLPSGRSIATFL